MHGQGRGSGQKRGQLLQAAERLMLQRGFWGTSVDDVCKAAAVSKGSFFHYFEDKEQLALAALDQFIARMVSRVREAVASKDPADAYGRICSYCDLIAHAAQVQNAQQGCLIAAFVLETRSDDSEFSKRCAAHFGSWIELLRREFVAALSAKHWPKPSMPDELAQLCICVIEGALILARGRGDPLIVVSALDHFKRYLGSLLGHGIVAQSTDKPAAASRRRLASPGRVRRPRTDRRTALTEYERGNSRARARKEALASKR